LHYQQRLNVPLDMASALVLVIAGFSLLPTEGLSWLVLLLWGGAILLILVVFFGLFLMPWLICRLNDKLGERYRLAFSDEEIHFQTKDIDSHIDWSFYDRMVFNRHAFLLYHGRATVTVVPTDVFRDKSEREAFEELLRMKIPRVEEAKQGASGLAVDHSESGTGAS
jgi:hypothetical protein